MKRTILASVSAAALILGAGSAFAQDLTNKSTVTQSGNAQDAIVAQTGTSNVESTVVQSGGFNFAKVTQSGSDNDVTVEQEGDIDLTSNPTPSNSNNLAGDPDPDATNSNEAIVSQAGSANAVLIYQNGNNRAEATQSVDSEGSSSTINQFLIEDEPTLTLLAVEDDVELAETDGVAGNLARTIQNGTGTSFIDQSGSGSVAVVRQEASTTGASSDIYQGPGRDQRASVIQLNGAAESIITQSGTPFALSAQNASNYQDGDSRSYITQSGGFNQASVRQVGGNGNQSDVTQSGFSGLAGDPDNNYSSADSLARVGVLQNGDDNTSTINQSGQDNFAEVSQTDDDNTSTIVQNGDYSAAMVTQKGDNNTSTIDSQTYEGGSAVSFADAIVDQNGDDNTSAISQQAENTFASVDQDGNDNNSEISQTSTAAGASATVTQDGSNPLGGFVPRDGFAGNRSYVEQTAGATATVNQLSGGLGGGLNRSSITQNDAATATVEQTGVFNKATVNQFDGALGAEATVTQGDASGTGYGDNFATVDQYDGATATVNQQNDDSAPFRSDSPSNIAAIEQNFGSAGAEATINQTGDDNLGVINQDADATATITQFGGPSAGVAEFGVAPNDYESENNLAVIDQQAGSDDATATSAQSGLLNVSSILQTGSSDAYVSQVGDNNLSQINQSADGNTASVVQGTALTAAGIPANFSLVIPTEGLSDSDSEIAQNGTNGLVEVAQSGTEQSSTVRQWGDLNSAFVTQSGEDNTSVIDQGNVDFTSSGNMATVDQSGFNGNMSTITQNGTGNTASVTQNSGF